MKIGEGLNSNIFCCCLWTQSYKDEFLKKKKGKNKHSGKIMSLYVTKLLLIMLLGIPKKVRKKQIPLYLGANYSRYHCTFISLSWAPVSSLVRRVGPALPDNEALNGPAHFSSHAFLHFRPKVYCVLNNTWIVFPKEFVSFSTPTPNPSFPCLSSNTSS